MTVALLRSHRSRGRSRQMLAQRSARMVAMSAASARMSASWRASACSTMRRSSRWVAGSARPHCSNHQCSNCSTFSRRHSRRNDGTMSARATINAIPRHRKVHTVCSLLTHFGVRVYSACAQLSGTLIVNEAEAASEYSKGVRAHAHARACLGSGHPLSHLDACHLGLCRRRRVIPSPAAGGTCSDVGQQHGRVSSRPAPEEPMSANTRVRGKGGKRRGGRSAAEMSAPSEREAHARGAPERAAAGACTTAPATPRTCTGRG